MNIYTDPLISLNVKTEKIKSSFAFKFAAYVCLGEKTLKHYMI